MSQYSNFKNAAIVILTAAGALNAAPVLAAATYSFDCSVTDCSNSNTSAWGNTRTQTVSGITVTASAISNTTGSSTTSNAATQTIDTAYLAAFGTVGSSSGSNGLGVRNRDVTGTDIDTNEGVAPEHAIDNNQRYDMVLLSFSSAVTLSQIKLGYVNTDSDVSLLAYGGAGTTPPLTGLTYAQLVTNGWVAVGSYADVAVSTNKTVNTANYSSKTWLVGAYNPLTGDTSCAACTTGNDYFKLLSITIATASSSASSTQVPEPASLALVGLALAGIAASRRVKK